VKNRLFFDLTAKPPHRISIHFCESSELEEALEDLRNHNIAVLEVDGATLSSQEYRVVRVDHEDILCNWKVRVTGELWPSFIKLVESALNSDDPQVYYEEPIQ
jgi:hypothetical protein